MNAPRTFTVESTKHIPPIEFSLVDDEGNDVGTFRATPKPRTDVAQMLASAVQLHEGNRVYNVNVLSDAVKAMLVRKVWQERTVVDPDDGEERTVGTWVDVDDVARFEHLLTADEVRVPIEQVGAICMWLLEETTGHPTGAPKS